MKRHYRILAAALAAALSLSALGAAAYYPCNYYPNTFYGWCFQGGRSVSLGGVRALSPAYQTLELIVNDTPLKLRIAGLNDMESTKKISINPNAAGTALYFTENLARDDDGALMLTLKPLSDTAGYYSTGIWCTADAIAKLGAWGVQRLQYQGKDTFTFDIAELTAAASGADAKELLIKFRYETEGAACDALDEEGGGLNSRVCSVNVYDNTSGRTDISDGVNVYANMNCDSANSTLLAYYQYGDAERVQTKVLLNKNANLIQAGAKVPAGSYIAAVLKKGR